MRRTRGWTGLSDLGRCPGARGCGRGQRDGPSADTISTLDATAITSSPVTTLLAYDSVGSKIDTTSASPATAARTR